MAKDRSEKRKGLADLDRSPVHLLHRSLQLALDIYGEELGPDGVTQRQYAVLAAADSAEGLSQTDLVRITGIDRSTLADMAARMIKKGLLERERSAVDGRANAVRLTEAGRAALENARPRAARADERLLRILSSGKRDSLTKLLAELVRKAEGEPKPAKAEKPPKEPKKKKKAKKLALVAAA